MTLPSQSDTNEHTRLYLVACLYFIIDIYGYIADEIENGMLKICIMKNSRSIKYVKIRKHEILGYSITYYMSKACLSQILFRYSPFWSCNLLPEINM